jgi:hypothetical protein
MKTATRAATLVWMMVPHAVLYRFRRSWKL